MNRTQVLIMGAAGRDFHNFNVYFKNKKEYNVAAFTAAQIPDIAGRKYPKELAGKLYPKGIPIFEEKELASLIKKFKVDLVVLAYSDLSHFEVMHKASIAGAAGADFLLLGPNSTMLKSKKPVVSICAVRTGSGKSQTTRKVAKILQGMGKKIVVVRHPMPYGDLRKQIVQRFETYADLEKQNCTIEEREEYEPHINNGIVVYAGVDYEKILKEAEKEADIIIWDGGNNDFPFYKTDLHIVVADPLRAGHEVSYYPGETNVRMADVAVINKIDSATKEQVKTVQDNIEKINPSAKIIKAESKLFVEHPEKIRGKKVLAVEDGPTVTHGEMGYGAAFVAAKRFGAAEIIDPRPFAVGAVKETFMNYPHLHNVLPTVGYGKKQVKELEQTINSAKCDIVLSGAPVDLGKIVKMNKEIVQVRYELKEIEGSLEVILREFAGK